MADPDVAWAFSAGVPFATFGIVGACTVFLFRKRALDAWDLATLPNAPGAARPTIAIAVVAGIVALCYILYNFFGMDAIPPEQQWSNSGFCTVGTVLGVLAAHFFGLRFAERRYRNGG